MRFFYVNITIGFILNCLPIFYAVADVIFFTLALRFKRKQCDADGQINL